MPFCVVSGVGVRCPGAELRFDRLSTAERCAQRLKRAGRAGVAILYTSGPVVRPELVAAAVKPTIAPSQGGQHGC